MICPHRVAGHSLCGLILSGMRSGSAGTLRMWHMTSRAGPWG